jgi:hypothetical protein
VTEWLALARIIGGAVLFTAAILWLTRPAPPPGR